MSDIAFVRGVSDPSDSGASSLSLVPVAAEGPEPLWVELAAIKPSQALERWLGGSPDVPALCAAFQTGQCYLSETCALLHVDPAHVAALRRPPPAAPPGNCCAAHGDVAHRITDFQSFLREVPVLVKRGLNDYALPPQRIALTMFWDPFMSGGVRPTDGALRMSCERICRMHQRDACRFGVECKNLHVCREFWTMVTALNGTTKRSLPQRSQRSTSPPSPVSPPPRPRSPPQQPHLGASPTSTPPSPVAPPPAANPAAFLLCLSAFSRLPCAYREQLLATLQAAALPAGPAAGFPQPSAIVSSPFQPPAPSVYPAPPLLPRVPDAVGSPPRAPPRDLLPPAPSSVPARPATPPPPPGSPGRPPLIATPMRTAAPPAPKDPLTALAAFAMKFTPLSSPSASLATSMKPSPESAFAAAYPPTPVSVQWVDASSVRP